MELPVGGNSFQDRPGTRIRIVLPRGGTKKHTPVRLAFSWVFKIFFALVAGVFCVGIVSYAPCYGPPMAAYVPAQCSLLIHAPSGAALHRAFLDCPALGELLDDPDTAAFVESFAKTPPAAQSSETAETARPSLRSRFEKACAKIPWTLSWLIPPDASGIYPFAGEECAVALTRSDETVSNGKSSKKGSTNALILTRVSGWRGHLARLGFVFFHKTKNVEIFDLGGGLIAVGVNGARPAFERHVPPKVVAEGSDAQNSTLPLLRISYSPSTAAAPALHDLAIDLSNDFLARMTEEGIPDSVLRALQNPPAAGEMLNWQTPPSLARIDFFAVPGGSFTASGRIDGPVPKLAAAAQGSGAAQPGPSDEMAHTDFLADLPAGGKVVAEMVLPIDLQACFLRYIESGMKLTKDAEGLTRGQRLWMSRFDVLRREQVDLDRSLWPALGHTAVVEIHEAQQDLNPTLLGIIKAWLRCDSKNPETRHAVAALGRARWDYLFDNDERVTVKPPFVRRFPAADDSAASATDRFVLATGKINTPSWSVGPAGFRITTDAGIFALRDGPKDEEFISAPKALTSYRVRLDGARLPSTADSLLTWYYGEVENDLGSQKFMARHIDVDAHTRLARKWISLLGKLALVIVPDSNDTDAKMAAGADVKLSWKPSSMAAALLAPVQKDKKDAKPDPKKADDDDAPPPPPAN